MIKHCTLIEWFNSLTRCPQWSRHLSQPTLLREGEAKRKAYILQKRERAGVATNVSSRKTLEKPKRRSVNFENKDSEVVYTQGRYQHPTCSSQGTTAFNQVCNVTSKIIYFSLFYIFLFFGSTRGCPCSYVSSSAMRNSDLRSSLK